MRPSVRKVLSDLTVNKLRTVLVILSISVGVLAVGFIATSFPIILNDMDADFQSVNPHAAIIYCDSFDDELLNSVRRVDGLGQAEGRSNVSGRLLTGPDEYIAVDVLGVPPIDEMQIDKIQPVTEGQEIVFEDRHIFFDYSGKAAIDAEPGDILQIKLSDGRVRELVFSGYLHDVTAFPYAFTNQLSAYVTPDTIEWLGGSLDYYQMYITVAENKKDEEHVTRVAKTVADKIEKSGREIYYTFVYEPGRHFATDITTALGVMMGFLGALSVLLSAFLVINTITALLSQHIRQIGIMKSIGGKTYQLLIMYLGLVFCFGLIALLIAMPLSSFFAYQVAGSMANYLNFKIRPFQIPAASIILQVLIAMLVPIAAALYPVYNGTRLTIREAISNYGLGKGQFGKNWFDRQLEKIQQLPRPMTLSLRNTFRKKGRLLLTLSTLTLAGAIFIAVFNVKSSLYQAIDEAYGYFLSDVNINFNNTYRIEKIKSLAEAIPDVVEVEGWGFVNGQILSEDKKTSTQVVYIAPPAGSTLIEPVMIDGRWLLQDDQNAIVIGNHLLKVMPELKVGDDLVIQIDGKESEWHIIGIFKMPGNADPPLIYANHDYLAKVQNEVGKISSARILTSSHDRMTQQKVADFLESCFKTNGIQISNIETSFEQKELERQSIDVLVYLLLSMAILIAIVGGLGLMGTMSMNVLERTREIGVMRAIGAKDRSIIMLVVVEGLVIGCISWILGSLLSVPISLILSNVVGISILSTPLDFVFSMDGFLMWLVGVLIISTIASAMPARNASQLTIREVLAYE